MSGGESLCRRRALIQDLWSLWITLNIIDREATARFDSPDFGLPVLIQLVYLLMIRIDTQL